MSQIDLTDVIEDSVNDSIAPDTSTDTSVDTSTDVSADSGADDTSTDVSESSEVQSPGARTSEPDAPEGDDFAKKFGVNANSVTGRENRIPYSRVKKIADRAAQEAKAAAAKEHETKFQPKIAEYEAKVQDYEGRLGRVAQFEQILENDPKTFLNMLSQHPAYKEFFEYVGKAINTPAGTPAPEQRYLDDKSMPQPDQQLADGTMVYSLEGLSKRDEWLARQVEEKAVAAAEARMAKRYEPIEKEWQSQQHMAKVVPVIQKQIAEARTWPQFNENEADIVAVLKQDPQISLEGAYRKVVFPRLQSSRDEMRTSILAELKKQPVTTAAPQNATRPVHEQTGPRNLEDIVRQAAEDFKAKGGGR